MDPWYDYLALPVGPLLLGLQAALLSRPRGLRVLASSVCFAAVAAMFVFVTYIVPAGEGANIGAGLLLLQMPISLLLLVAALVPERTAPDAT